MLTKQLPDFSPIHELLCLTNHAPKLVPTEDCGNESREQIGSKRGRLFRQRSKGLTLSITASGALDGILEIDFDQPTSPLSQIGKDLVIASIAQQGLMIDEIKDWATGDSGDSITLGGRVSTETLSTLVMLILIPSGSVCLGEGGADSRAESLRVETSKRYFTQVTTLLKDFRAKANTSVISHSSPPLIAISAAPISLDNRVVASMVSTTFMEWAAAVDH